MDLQGFFFDTSGCVPSAVKSTGAWNDPEDELKLVGTSKKSKKSLRLDSRQPLRSYRQSIQYSCVTSFESQTIQIQTADSKLRLENIERIRITSRLTSLSCHLSEPCFAMGEYKKFSIFSGSSEGYRLQHSFRSRHGPFDSCTFHGNYLLCYGNSDGLSKFDIESLTEINYRAVTGTKEQVGKVVSSDGSALVLDAQGALSLIDIRTMKKSFRLPYSNICAMSYGKDEHDVILASKEGKVIRHDLRKSLSLVALQSPLGAVTSLSFHREANEIMCGFDSGYVQLIDARDSCNLKELEKLDSISTPITAMSSSNCSNLSVLSSFDSRHAIKIYDHANDNFIHAAHLAPVPSKCRALGFVGRDQVIFASESQAFVYNISANK